MQSLGIKKRKYKLGKKVKLQKFGIKLFFELNKSYIAKSFISVFHNWIQEKSIKDHLLIDVADYSHMLDGPGVMLIGHEGNFSLDQENNKYGLLYMRKTMIEGDFTYRFNKVLSILIDAANRLKDDNYFSYINNSFRFISNDRLNAVNTIENQELYKEKINIIIKKKYPNSIVRFEDFSSVDERLAFSIKLNNEISILD
tara:strand:+ start:127 stop:723 length:597 start_codon:yes stop_codon:yes gene_type:complete